MLSDVAELARLGAQTGIIGRTARGTAVPYVAVGEGRARVIVTAAIHARENVTARLAIEQARRALGSAAGRICFVPMVNPDGALLLEKGARAFGVGSERELLALNGGSADFSMWKANARGVDLNVNFDARYGSGRLNRSVPGAANCIGPYAESEPETRALCAFTRAVSPELTISYHAKGREMYWYFYQTGEAIERDREIARKLNMGVGYRVAGAATDSAGGYKDWCVERLHIPAVTIEAGADELNHPIDFYELSPAEREGNIMLPLRAAELIESMLAHKK